MKKFLPSCLAIIGAFASAGLWAEGEGGAATSGGGGLNQTLIMIGIALLFFYFILWRPEQKRRKGMEKLRTSLKKGDKVTAMGIIGIVAKVQDDTIIVRMVDGAKVEFLKAAISSVEAGSGEVEDVEEKKTNKKVELLPEKE